MINLFVVDNFHPKPYELREFALKQDFNVDGNYPGHRTRSFLRDIDYKLNIDGICRYIYGLFSETNIRVAIQSFTKMYKSFIHLVSDNTNIEYVILFIDIFHFKNSFSGS